MVSIVKKQTRLFVSLLCVLVVLALVAFSLFFDVTNNNNPQASNGPRRLPPIESNFVNLSYMKEISLFRSCEGHVKVPADGDEPSSNMNHYFFVKDEYFDQKTPIPIYSPYTGFIYSGDGNNLYIPPWETGDTNTFDGNWFLEIYHVRLVAGLVPGQAVTAGQLIAYKDYGYGGNGIDLIIARKLLFPMQKYGWMSPYKEMDSIFNYMPDSIFAEYEANGVVSKESMIISKEFRTQHPCQLDTNDSSGFYYIRSSDPARPGVVTLRN